MPGKINSESGFSLIESLTAIMISSSVLLATSSLFSSTVKANHDQKIRTETLVHAQAVLQMIGNELKPLGNGVPFDQANFEIGETTLSDTSVSFPIDVANTDNTQISFRLNETGEIALLTQDFDPTASTTVYLSNITSYQANDPIYISNSVVAGDDGLYAKIQAVNPDNNSIILDGASLIYSPAAQFKKGSVLEEVPLVQFKNLSSGQGITRDSGYGAVLLADDATVSFEYLDSDGNALSLPLDASTIVNSLRVIRLNVVKSHANKLTTGQTYQVTVSQSFALRNLNILY